jgi:hypothetical protein
MVLYADKVIVNGMSSASCISSLLNSSDIGRQTSILFLHNPPKLKENPTALSVAKYSWEHPFQRPNTHTIPLMCPICHKVQPWCPPESIVRKDGASFTLPCKTKTWGKKGEPPTWCSGQYEVGARPPSTLVEAPYVGAWYSHDLSPVDLQTTGEAPDEVMGGDEAMEEDPK